MTKMVDIRKTLQQLGKQVRQLTDQVSDAADQVAKSNEVASIKKEATEEIGVLFSV